MPQYIAQKASELQYIQKPSTFLFFFAYHSHSKNDYFLLLLNISKTKCRIIIHQNWLSPHSHRYLLRFTLLSFPLLSIIYFLKWSLNLNEPSPNKSHMRRLPYPKRKSIPKRKFPSSCRNSKRTFKDPCPLSLKLMIKNCLSPKTFSKRPTKPSTTTKFIPIKNNSKWPNKLTIWEDNSRGQRKKSMSFSKYHKSTKRHSLWNRKKSALIREFNAGWETKKWRKSLKIRKNKTFRSNKGFRIYSNN